MQASYRGEQDRVFLSLSTHEHENLRFILTRRISKAILGSMDVLFGQEVMMDLAIPPPVKGGETTSVQSEGVLSQFAIDAKYPLGKKYLLVTNYVMALEEEAFEQMVKITLECITQKTIELHMNTKTFNDLLSLLAQTVEESDWGLIDVASRGKFIHNGADSVEFLN